MLLLRERVPIQGPVEYFFIDRDEFKIDIPQVGRLELPPALLQAPGLQSPYLSLFSLTADGSGARSMKSRGNLQRSGQQTAS